MAYITDFEPFIPDEVDYERLSQIEKNIKNKESILADDANFFLNHVSFFTRKIMNPDMDNFRNKCDLAQSILYHYFSKLDCRQNPVATQEAITTQIVGHNFLTLELIVDEVPTLYLVDPTYIQFFEEQNCSIQKFYVSPLSPDRILITPDPGFFIKNNQKDMAKFLIDHGYSLLTPEVARMYGDSFFNTKVGVSLSNWKYQTMNGQIYINSFVKSNCNLSKSEEDLEKDGMLLTPFSELQRK